MAQRVTIQDIADALGLSRNTVSKAINGTGVLAEATRQRVLQKASEMGYKQFSFMVLPMAAQEEGEGAPRSAGSANEAGSPGSQSAKKVGIISLLTTENLGNSHFSSTMLDRFQRELSRQGYSFMIHRITQEDIALGRLPSSFHSELTQGIICIEVFNPSYANMICGLGLPTLFVDAPSSAAGERLSSDILLMDNRTEIISFVRDMVREGKKIFGFIGEELHCLSFYERFHAMLEGLYLENLPFHKEYVLSNGIRTGRWPDASDYQDYLETALRQMPGLPDVFLCANDFVAMDALDAFRRLGIRVPEDVLLFGFDNSPESRVLTPSLSTVHIHSQIMGMTAASLLLSRIREPSLNYRTVYTETMRIYRDSTAPGKGREKA